MIKSKFLFVVPLTKTKMWKHLEIWMCLVMWTIELTTKSFYGVLCNDASSCVQFRGKFMLSLFMNFCSPKICFNHDCAGIIKDTTLSFYAVCISPALFTYWISWMTEQKSMDAVQVTKKKMELVWTCIEKMLWQHCEASTKVGTTRPQRRGWPKNIWWRDLEIEMWMAGFR